MKRSHFSPNPKGFSLVEILVVIAIISVLAGASYPVITSALTKGKITESKKVASELVIAIDAFEEKFGFFPHPSGRTPSDIEVYTTDDGDFLRVLMGQDEDINETNTKFFEADSTSNKKNGIEFASDGKTPKGLYDPWGNPYVIVIDNTGDREIPMRSVRQFSEYKGRGGKDSIIFKNAAVATPGPDKEFNDVKDVKSWD